MFIGSNDSPDSPKNNFLKTGPPLVGIILNWCLYGILIMQYLIYWNHVAKRDNRILQITVHILFLLDTIQTILAMKDAFNRFVYNFGNYEAMLDDSIAGLDSPVTDALIAMVVQFVYCWRIWMLSNQRVLPCIIAFLAFVAGVSGIIVGIADTVTNYVHNVALAKWYTAVMLWLWTSFATDILIAASMTYLLKFRSTGCSQNARAVAKRLLMFTLETNAITAIVAMVTAIIPLIKPLQAPSTNILLVGGYVLGKLYSNCFMVLLNQRIYYENPSQGHHGPITELTSLEARAGLRFLRSGNAQTVNGVAITKVTAVHVSEGPNRVDFKSESDDGIELDQIKSN